MGEQVTDRDGVDGTELVVDFAQFRYVAECRIVERELTAIAQLQDGDGGHGLGDGGPVVGGSGIYWIMRAGYHFAKGQCLRLGSIAVNKREPAADDTVLLEDGLELWAEGVDRGRMRNALRTRRSSEQA